MKWYPWLNNIYRKIISRYQHGNGHHAILLHSQSGNGELSLCYAISRWLMCQNPTSMKSCNICDSCQLMITGNHPDFYQLNLETDYYQQSIIGIDRIRYIIDNLYQYSHQKGIKLVQVSYIELLTEQATNAILKTLEDPPANTYFLFICRSLSLILPTIKSRCLCWLLQTPDEAFSIMWLKQIGFDNDVSVLTALRLCSNAPLAAKALLQPDRWQERIMLCKKLKEAHIKNDFLILLPMLNKEKDNGPLLWLLGLIVDALKWKHGIKQNYLVNMDKIDLIAIIAMKWSSKVLHKQWQHWLCYLRQWQEIKGINRELLLTYYLLNWEQSSYV